MLDGGWYDVVPNGEISPDYAGDRGPDFTRPYDYTPQVSPNDKPFGLPRMQSQGERRSLGMFAPHPRVPAAGGFPVGLAIVAMIAGLAVWHFAK